jgi:AcrR family transcriptional regulator
VTTEPRRRGPAPRFSQEQLVDAAVAVVRNQGFAALSLRSVARHLGVGPMTLYTYVDSSDELAALVVERLVDDAVRGVRWPRAWRGVLRVLAKELHTLVVTHPAMVEAYERGMVRSGRAGQIAAEVQARLVSDGMTPEQAGEAYVAVHSLVLGFAVIRSVREPDAAAIRSDRDLLLRLVDKLLIGFGPRPGM